MADLRRARGRVGAVIPYAEEHVFGAASTRLGSRSRDNQWFSLLAAAIKDENVSPPVPVMDEAMRGVRIRVMFGEPARVVPSPTYSHH